LLYPNSSWSPLCWRTWSFVFPPPSAHTFQTTAVSYSRECLGAVLRSCRVGRQEVYRNPLANLVLLYVVRAIAFLFFFSYLLGAPPCLPLSVLPPELLIQTPPCNSRGACCPRPRRRDFTVCPARGVFLLRLLLFRVLSPHRVPNGASSPRSSAVLLSPLRGPSIFFP